MPATPEPSHLPGVSAIFVEEGMNTTSTKRNAERLRLRSLSAKPGAALGEGIAIATEVVSVIYETVMRGGKGPETLRETGMNQTGTSPFKNVKERQGDWVREESPSHYRPG
eukprot:2964894-Heterocapsa_arctica.AAC.1